MRYFVADLHCGHDLIQAMHQTYPHSNTLFESVELKDEYVINSINLRVKPKDELYIIGDFSTEPGKYRARINCKHVYLIRGNHDPVQKSLNVFGSIPYMRIVKLRSGDGKSLKCVLSHTPQVFWEGSHRGWASLYGHCHGQRELWMDQHMGYERRSTDVSIDNLRRVNGDYFPPSEQELYNMFIQRKGHDMVEYYDAIQKQRNKGLFNE